LSSLSIQTGRNNEALKASSDEARSCEIGKPIVAGSSCFCAAWSAFERKKRRPEEIVFSFEDGSGEVPEPTGGAPVLPKLRREGRCGFWVDCVFRRDVPNEDESAGGVAGLIRNCFLGGPVYWALRG
jgi:hypothetical protein